MIVEEIKGNLLDTKIKCIAHGVNCQNVMGSGVAKAILTKYPEVKESYHNFCTEMTHKVINGPEDLLGMVGEVQCSDGKLVYNCFTQENFGYDGEMYVSYIAVAKCFDLLNKEFGVKEIAIPKIGCGLAGGDWKKMKDIINEHSGDMKITVYYL